MADDWIPPEIRSLIRKFEQLPSDDPGMLDAMVAVLLAFRDVPRKHHARLFDVMRAFVDISKEQKALLVRIAGEDFHGAGVPADSPRTNRDQLI